MLGSVLDSPNSKGIAGRDFNLVEDRGRAFSVPDPRTPALKPRPRIKLWQETSIESTTIFIGDDDVVTDVIISGAALAEPHDTWTRSASDYGASVQELRPQEDVRLVVVWWRTAVEIYLPDMKNKLVSLASQKGGLVTTTYAMVGSCE